MITTILNLNISAAARSKTVDQVTGSFSDRHDVIHLDGFRFADEVRS